MQLFGLSVHACVRNFSNFGTMLSPCNTGAFDNFAKHFVLSVPKIHGKIGSPRLLMLQMLSCKLIRQVSSMSVNYRGKLLNVRDASAAQIAANAEIQAIKQIMGLQHGKVLLIIPQHRYDAS